MKEAGQTDCPNCELNVADILQRYRAERALAKLRERDTPPPEKQEEKKETKSDPFKGLKF